MLNIGFPVFAVSIVPAHLPGKYHVIVGGGGGPSKSGVPNGVALYVFNTTSPDRPVHVNTINSEGDAVMCISQSHVAHAICPKFIVGVGIRGWLCAIAEGKLVLLSSTQTDLGGGEDPHQRMGWWCGAYIVTVACDSMVRIWNDKWEEEYAIGFTNSANECISDICCIGSTQLLVVIDHMQIYSIQMEQWKKSVVAAEIQSGYSIRCIRYFESENVLILVQINRSKRHSIIQVVESGDKWNILTTTSVNHIVTTLFLHHDGLMAVGCSDGIVFIYQLSDNYSLRLINKYEHSFAVTSVSICDSIIVSGSADGSITVKELFVFERSADSIVNLFCIVLMILFSLLIRAYCDQFKLL